MRKIMVFNDGLLGALPDKVIPDIGFADKAVVQCDVTVNKNFL